MPRIDISQLPDQSRIWIFGVSPALNERKSSRMLAAIDRFLDSWSAHGQPIVSARDLIDGSFLVIAVDQRSETSGCSIDRMFGLLQQLERELAISILDPDRVFSIAEQGAIRALSRAEFRTAGGLDTVVVDILAERLSDVRSGIWKRPAATSWHRSLLETIG